MRKAASRLLFPEPLGTDQRGEGSQLEVIEGVDRLEALDGDSVHVGHLLAPCSRVPATWREQLSCKCLAQNSVAQVVSVLGPRSESDLPADTPDFGKAIDKLALNNIRVRKDAHAPEGSKRPASKGRIGPLPRNSCSIRVSLPTRRQIDEVEIRDISTRRQLHPLGAGTSPFHRLLFGQIFQQMHHHGVRFGRHVLTHFIHLGSTSSAQLHNPTPLVTHKIGSIAILNFPAFRTIDSAQVHRVSVFIIAINGKTQAVPFVQPHSQYIRWSSVVGTSISVIGPAQFLLFPYLL